MKEKLITTSIVIPIFNNCDGLKRTLKALSDQTYPKEYFEVIVIDNGSDDPPDEVVNEYKEQLDIHFLKELNYLKSPYSARNRGIEKSRGEIIVLLDSTCAPVEGWLEAGLGLITSPGIDMVGGNIEFEINENSSLSAIYDSLMNADMQKNVKRNTAVGGNLFIKADIFNKTGKFPEGLRSGGDISWTHNATKSGYTLEYSKDAKVFLRPKNFRTLTRKQFRVAKGHPTIWKENNNFTSNILKRVFLAWLPPNPSLLLKKSKECNHQYVRKKFVKLLFLGWYLRIVNGLGNIAGLKNL